LVMEKPRNVFVVTEQVKQPKGDCVNGLHFM